MNKKKIGTENENTFSDLTTLSQFREEDTIKVGENFPKIMKGEFHSRNQRNSLWKPVSDVEDFNRQER